MACLAHHGDHGLADAADFGQADVVNLLRCQICCGPNLDVMRVPGLAIGQIAHGDGLARARQVDRGEELMQTHEGRTQLGAVQGFGALLQQCLLVGGYRLGHALERSQQRAVGRRFRNLIEDLLRDFTQRDPRRGGPHFQAALQPDQGVVDQ